MAAKKPRTSPTSEPPSAQVVLRTKTASLPVTPQGHEQLETLAYTWSRTVENRKRWDGAEQDRKAVEEAAVQALEILLGRSREELLDLLALQPLLEVSIRWGSDEAESWAARKMPWEFLISTATRTVRQGSRLLVVRHLDCGPRPPLDGPPKPAHLCEGLILCSTPPLIGLPLKSSLMDEARSVYGIWKKQGIEAHLNENPSLEEFHLALKKGAKWIHFLGVNGRDLGEKQWHSIVISGGSPETLVTVEADDLRKLVQKAAIKPSMAVFNFCRSASRLAASAVAGGAEAAIGFQDSVSDQTCMDIVGTFYPALMRRGGDHHAAFVDLWDGMESALNGASIVLWSARPLLPGSSTPTDRVSSGATDEMNHEKPGIQYGFPDALEVKCETVGNVNFSLLHNALVTQNRYGIFKRLEIGKLEDPPMKDVFIEITVNDGGSNSSWKKLKTFNRGGVCIAKEVTLSFISGMVRSLKESLVTGIQISISTEGRLRYSTSESIRLLAIDEWIDDKDSRHWLPSFIHSRDPAVAGIITRAEGYLQALRDDFGAGFDGYQPQNPESVELQVRALWVAISRDCDIRYINPPPTYTKSSQRLRRPCEIVSTRQGTCLDLALLLAACLEWIGVYPVIFLIKGHAFPGYWSDESYYQEFYDYNLQPPSPDPANAEAPRETTDATPLEIPWVAGSDRRSSILREVQSGRLVPIETVWLTNTRSFSDAVQAGGHNLYSPEAFECLIDVRRARDCGITPLPLPDNL